MSKICKKCKLTKPFNEFHRSKHGKNGYRSVCKICQSLQCKNYYNSNKDKVSKMNINWQKSSKGKQYARFKYIRKHYGLTKEEWMSLLESQQYKCKICKEFNTDLGFFQTDHCHISGIVRGLLCQNCNKLLGHAKDKVEILKSAINYLTEVKMNY